jgi:hypothetical protein
MTPQKNPDRLLSFLRRQDGSWNLLVILGSALGAIFVAYMLLDSPASAPIKIANPAQTQVPSTASKVPAK